MSGILIVLWVLSLYGIIVGVWWQRLQEYFVSRGLDGSMKDGNRPLAAIALTGHFCDVTMGMVLLPVTRNSALASFFRLSASTTFAFHMIQAYVLFALVLTHGFIYASWVAVYNHNEQLARLVFPVLNPTYLYHEVWPGNISSLGVWRASLIFTGLLTTLIFLAIFSTTFPVIRRKHFNLFYFTHLLAPGLVMWVVDWWMRLYELSDKVDSTLTAVGKGWFCLTLPLPRRRLDGCACHSPLAHFHIHHMGTSIREIHPFSTITHLASQKATSPSSDESVMIQFLFRKSKATQPAIPTGNHPHEKRSSQQWTNKLAGLVDEESTCIPQSSEEAKDLGSPKQKLPVGYHTHLRLEGPYFTPANPERYNTVICLVAGTGISGAIAIAAAFSQQPQVPPIDSGGLRPLKKILSTPSTTNNIMPARTENVWKRCVVVWSVRESDHIDLPFIDEATPGLEVRSHLTGKGHTRLDMEATIREICSKEPGGSTWVYISGPNAFIEVGEKACRNLQSLGVEFFGTRWL
ncbi:hypothetical protein MMC28_010790 [Mycoblastus sanguinarius]|nr:hypothetical protein [Mycoblastus sanguinarius]